MADRRITKEILGKMEMDLDGDTEEAEDVEFGMPKIKRRLLGDFCRPSILDQPIREHMKVYLRIRPFSEEEIERNESQGCLDIESDFVLKTVAPKDSHYYKKASRGACSKSITTNKYTFSHIYKEDTSQKEFFNDTMLDFVKDFIDGQNCLVFSYGVTSSGKTYTIQGEPKDAGILPRVLDVLFNSISGRQWSGMDLKPDLFMGATRLSEDQVLYEQKMKERIMKMSCDDDMDVMSLLGDDASDVSIATNTTASSEISVMSIGKDEHEFLEAANDRVREDTKVCVEDQGQIRYSVWVSFAEIYNEQIYDLLEGVSKKKNVRRPCLKLSDDQNGSPYVKGLKYIRVTSADEAYKLLTIGQRNLKTACTKLNHNSSRSHCIFSIKVLRVMDKDTPHVARVSMLSLCDLAGSERLTKTNNTGERLKEAGNINTSLMTLGRCIETLRFNQSHKDNPRIVPFRDSKLTRLFQNFFVGQGKAAMIVNVNQLASMYDETQHVFKFSAIASQVIVKQKPVFVKPRLPVVMPSQNMLARSSIMWATTPSKEKVEALPVATNLPLPEGSDDDLDESIEEVDQEVFTRENIDELLAVIDQLQEDLDKEKKTKAKLEASIRKEVCDEMMAQFSKIEEKCSEQFRLRDQQAEEMVEKRLQIYINAEKQKKKRDEMMTDGEDEWVSSLLLHQEKVKIEERNETIKQLKEEINALKSDADHYKMKEDQWFKEKNDLENQLNKLNQADHSDAEQQNTEDVSSKANLIENLTQQLQQSRECLQEKETEIGELNDMLTEAGETFVQRETEIEQLKELNADYEKKLESMKEDIKKMGRVAKDSKVAMETADQSLSKQEEYVTTLQAEIRGLEGDVNKYKNKARFFEEQIVEKEQEANDWKMKYENCQIEYTKNQEALIHGFTAEITNLKSQIFNFKSQLYGVKSPLKSPGSSLRSPDPTRIRLFSPSPRKTPGRESAAVQHPSPAKVFDCVQLASVEQNKEEKKMEEKGIQVNYEDEAKPSDLESTLTKELDNANKKIKELQPLMKDYFCKSKLLSQAEIKVEKLSDDAEYKNKAIIDCENRVQELEKELHDLKLALEQNEKVFGTEECELKEKTNKLDKILKNDMEIQTTFEEKVDMEEGTACEDVVKDQFKATITEKDKEMKILKEKLSKLKKGYRAKDQFFNEASEKCMELEFRINEQEIENQEFKSQYDEARNQMNMLQEVLNNKVEELARTGEELAVASLESEKSKRIVMEHRAKCESLVSEMKSLKERLQGDTSDQSVPDVNTVNKELMEKDNHVKEMIIKLEEMENGKKALEEKLRESTEILQQAQNKVEHLKVVITEKEDELSMIKPAQIRSCEDKEIQVEDLNRGKLNKDIESLKSKLQQTENEKEEQDKQLKDLNEKQTILMGQIKDLEGMKEEILKLESLMNDKEKMCKDLSENLATLEQKNANLQNELKAEKDATNTISKLRESILEKDEEIEMFKENLDATLLELEGKEKIEDGMKKLRKGIEEEKATVVGKEKEIVKLRELNKDLEERLGSMDKEESMHDLEAAVVDKEMELCERDKVITEQKSVIDNLHVEIEKLQGGMKMCDEKIESKEKEKIIQLSKLELVLKEKEEFIDKSCSELEEASKEKESLDGKIKDLEAAVVDKEMELCKRDKVITEQKSVIDNLHVEIEQLQGGMKMCDEKIESKEKEKNIQLSKLEMVLKEKEEFIDKSCSELEEASKEKETLDEKIEDLEKKLCRIAEEMEEKAMKNNSFDIERSRLQEKLEEAWEKIYKLEDEVEERSQQILDSKTNQDEMKQAYDDVDQNNERDLLAKHTELVSDVKRYKDLFEKIEAELKDANCELEKVKEQKNVLGTQSKEFQEVIEIVNKKLHGKVEELAVQKQLFDSKISTENANSNVEADLREKLNAITLENTEHVNEIEKYKQRVVSVKENCDKELESLKLKLDEVSTERDSLDQQKCDTKLLKESVNDLQSKVSLKVIEIETLKLEVKLLNEELSRVKGEKGIVEEKLQVRESVVVGHENLNLECDNASVTKLDELQRLFESEKKKNEEYQKLLTETSEMNCLSPQTGVRKLRKAKIDAENALAEAQYKVSSLESKVQDLETKHKCTENRQVNSVMSPNASDFLLQRKLNYFSTKLEESETKNVTMSKEIMELQCTVERLERDLNNERSNFDTTEREIHRRSRVSFMQNDPRQSIGSPSTKVELCKTREREQNLREQLKKSNDTIQEWLSKLTDTENQLKLKKQELTHAQETIKTLEAQNSEGERSTEKEVQQYMELTNELKLQIIRKEGDLEQNSNLIEDLRRQLDNKYSGVKNKEKDVKEKDELITLFKETLKEQESMLDEQAQMVSEKEQELEKSQQEYTELMEKYQHLLGSKDSIKKKNEGDVRKMARAEAERDLQADRVKELEDKLGQAEQDRSDAEKGLKKIEDEKSRLKSALNENNQELKELETNLTDVRRECEELRSQGADKNAAMHLEEAKRDMDKSVHELNVKVRNLQCQNKELSFKLSSAEEKLKSLTEEGKHSGEKEIQRFRDERDKLVSALEACLKKKDTEIKQLKVVIKQLKDKEIQTAQNWHEEREKIATGLQHLQHRQFVKEEVVSPEEDEDVLSSTDTIQEDKTVNEDIFSKPPSCPSSSSKTSKSRPPRPAPPSVPESDMSTMITKLEESPGSARKGSARRGRKRRSLPGSDDLPPLPKKSSREPLAETSILSETSEDYSSHLQIDATPKAAAKSLKRMRKRTGSVEETPIEETSTESTRRGSKRNAKSRLLQSFRESPIGKSSKKLLENIAETFSPAKSPTKSPIKSPRCEDEEPQKGRKRNKPSKENTPVPALEVPEKKSSRGRVRHKLYKDDTYISEPFESTGDFIQSPEDVHGKVTRSLRSRKR